MWREIAQSHKKMKISIIIPSRERGFYLRSSILTVLDIADQDIELIVATTRVPTIPNKLLPGFRTLA
jgi:hypothetical protein